MLNPQGNRPILILGASGQVGQRVLRAARTRYGGAHAVGTYQTKARDDLVHLELEDHDAIRGLVNQTAPWAVVLTAAFSWVDGCQNEPEQAWRINVEGPRIAASAAADVDAAFVYVSSDYVFDGTAGPYLEESAVRPISAYGASKLEGEVAVSEACARSLVVRTNVVYSWDPDGQNFLMQVRNKLSAGQKIKVPMDQWNTPTYAPDLAAGILDLLDKRATGLFHIGGPDFMDRYRLGLKIAAAFGLDGTTIQPVLTRDLNQPAPRPLKSGLLSSRFEKVTGRRTVGVEAGLAAARAEMRASTAPA